MKVIKEFQYSITIFIITIIFNVSVVLVSYKFFISDRFSYPADKITGPVIGITLMILSFFIVKISSQYFNLTTSRKTFLIFSTLFGSLLSIITFRIFLEDFNYSIKKINNIDDLHCAKSNGVAVTNFKIINRKYIYARLDSRRKNQDYYQLFIIYPFKSPDQNFYYALKFQEKIDKFSIDDNQVQYRKFFNKITDSLKTYNFKQTSAFEIINTYEDYDEFSKALPKNNGHAIFLRPVDELKKVNQRESIIWLLAGFATIFVSFTIIFFMSNIKMQ
jgi:hypothetical protein